MSLVVSRQGTDAAPGATAWCIKQMHHYVRTTILKLCGDGVSNSLGCCREGDQTIRGAFCMYRGKRLGTGKGDQASCYTRGCRLCMGRLAGPEVVTGWPFAGAHCA